MIRLIVRALFITALTLTLFGCATFRHHLTPATMSELQQGKREFNEGFYKRAMHRLLPLACDGNPEAQYAVGYMFYYGDGVAQDTDIGYFWIQRSANQGFPPAIQALKLIAEDKAAIPREGDKISEL